MKKNKRVIFGYILILVGIMLPLYNFLNMTYGEIFKQEEFKRYIASASEENTKEVQKDIEKYNENIDGEEMNFVDPFTDENYEREYSIYRDNPDREFGYLDIPKLDVKLPIYLDASVKHLAMGAAHIDGTHLPIGRPGRSVIAGHRGYYKDLMFFHLDRLTKGDHVYVYRGNETYDYVVDSTEIIFPYEWEKLKPIENVDMLTLLTCEPKTPPSPKRLLVNCVRAKEEVEDKKTSKVTVKEVKVDKSVKSSQYFIFGVTTLLSLALLYFVYKFIKYLRRK